MGDRNRAPASSSAESESCLSPIPLAVGPPPQSPLRVRHLVGASFARHLWLTPTGRQKLITASLEGRVEVRALRSGSMVSLRSFGSQTARTLIDPPHQWNRSDRQCSKATRPRISSLFLPPPTLTRPLATAPSADVVGWALQATGPHLASFPVCPARRANVFTPSIRRGAGKLESVTDVC